MLYRKLTLHLTAISNTRDIMKGIGSGASAIQRGLFGMLPGTEARSVNNNLDTVKALIGFDALARMRAASPTGGALGAITERELAFYNRYKVLLIHCKRLVN
jgi:hypothetical protein